MDRTIVVPEPDMTPIGLEPEVRVGTLSNGLTYYVRSNNSPGSQVSLQLVVKAGSPGASMSLVYAWAPDAAYKNGTMAARAMDSLRGTSHLW